MSKRKNKQNRHRNGSGAAPQRPSAQVDVAAPVVESLPAGEELQTDDAPPTIVVDADPDDLVTAAAEESADTVEALAEALAAVDESGSSSATPEPADQPSAEAAAEAAPAEGKSSRKRKNTREETVDPDLIEALLMTIDRPMPAARIAQVLEMETQRPIVQAIEALNAFYQKHDRSFRIELVAGGYQILTLPKYKPVLARLHKARGDSRLSPAALETLAIIAYKQPILRAELESIRGVACGEVLRSLMDRHLVKITGRAEEVGRPMLYGTTPTFLELFGLASLKDLPRVEELARN